MDEVKPATVFSSHPDQFGFGGRDRGVSGFLGHRGLGEELRFEVLHRDLVVMGDNVFRPLTGTVLSLPGNLGVHDGCFAFRGLVSGGAGLSGGGFPSGHHFLVAGKPGCCSLAVLVAIEFLGPLTVAALRSHNRRTLLWPAVAFVGVLLLTEPWHGSVNITGIGFAAGSAVGWAAYIVLTQHIGDRYSGLRGLGLTTPVAAATAAIFGVPQAVGQITPGVIAASLGLALLLPVLPFALEMTALRHMTPAAFGTLMALEPAIGVVLGLVVLHQHPSSSQALGITLVVLAGAAAQRNGRRQPPVPPILVLD